jgi:hypothetical protein
MTQKAVLFLTFSFMGLGCGVVKKSSGERFLKQDLGISSLRMDGYYYHIYGSESFKSVQVYFLYQNGKLLSTPNFSMKDDLTETEKYFRTKDFLKGIKDTVTLITRIYWTNFSIKNDSISLETIYPRQFYPHFILSGRIIDDTTFVITKRKGVAHISIPDRRTTDLSDTFYFRHFQPKPDSLNFGRWKAGS